MKRPSHRTQLCCGSPRLGKGARPFDSAQGRLLRLRSGQAPSTPLRAGSFDSAQGKLLRLPSGQAPSTSITAGHEASTGTAGAKALMLSALTARLKSCPPNNARSFNFAQGRVLRLRSGQAMGHPAGESFLSQVRAQRTAANPGHTAVVLQLTPKEGVEAHLGGFSTPTPAC